MKTTVNKNNKKVQQWNWDSPIIKEAVYCIVVILITTLLSLFVFDVVKISVSLCLISFGCLLGCVFAFFDKNKKAPVFFLYYVYFFIIFID